MRGDERDSRDLELVGALLSSTTVREAAAAVGVSEATLYRRMRVPEFRALIRESRRRAFGHALSRLQVASESAVRTLEDLMESKEAPAGVRIRAATVVLRLASSSALEDLELAQDRDELLESYAAARPVQEDPD